MNPYWELFRSFAVAELASGGPDPQVRLVARATLDLDPRHTAVAAGWFVAPYTCGAAAALWAADAWDWEEEQLQRWLVDHHDGLPTRRERRSIWGAEQRKLARCLVSWREWTQRALPLQAGVPYPEVYRSINDEVAYFGRYATMKVVEVLHQAGLVQSCQSDLRARGAKYPRKMLALLWPEHEATLNAKGDPAPAVQLAERLAPKVQVALTSDVGYTPTMFQVETLLCNARQSLDGKYPGRSHDRELAHWVKAEGYWGRDRLTAVLPFYELRWQLFPHQHLGEYGVPPWWGAREELEQATKARVQGTLCTSA